MGSLPTELSRAPTPAKPSDGGRSQRAKKASFGSNSTVKPSCTSGSVPEVGKMSRSTRCVLRRKRRQRPVVTGRSQATGRQEGQLCDIDEYFDKNDAVIKKLEM